jgi:hypothetical protein
MPAIAPSRNVPLGHFAGAGDARTPRDESSAIAIPGLQEDKIQNGTYYFRENPGWPVAQMDLSQCISAAILSSALLL